MQPIEYPYFLFTSFMNKELNENNTRNITDHNLFNWMLFVLDDKKLFEGLEDAELLQPGEQPNFTWLRDGKPFDPEDRFKVLFKVNFVEKLQHCNLFLLKVMYIYILIVVVLISGWLLNHVSPGISTFNGSYVNV